MHTETTGKTPRKASKMYGNKPPAARRLAQLPQHLADGGLVARMKSADAGPATFGSRGLSQLRDMIPQMQAMGYQQVAPAPAAQAPAAPPAPATDPRAAQLQAMIPRMEAMGFKQASAPQQQPQYFAEGGMVRGPGTGTSDSIEDEVRPGTFIMPADSTEAIGPDAMERLGTVPVRLSDGEFKLEPEQVMALGAAVLKLLKDTTHTPVNGEDGGQTDAEVGEGAGHEQSEAGGEGMEDEGEGEARGFNPAQRLAQMPKQLFADGGMVENDVTRVGNSYSGGNVGGSITVNGQAPAGTNSIVSTPALSPATAPTTPAVAPASPGAAPTAPGVAQASAVAPATTPAPPAPMGWAERNAQRNLQVSASSILDSPDRTAAQAALAPPPAPAPAALGFQSAAQRLGTAPSMPQPQLGFQPRRYADGGVVGDIPRRRYVDGGLTNTDEERAKLLAQIPTGGPVGWTGGGVAPAPVAAAPTSAGGSLTRAASMVPAPTPQAPPVAAPAEPVASGQPAAERMASVPQDTGIGFQSGVVTAQSNTAGDSLSRRAAADVLADTSSAPQFNVQAPTLRHSGNDWAARKALENAATAASSITANGGRFDETSGRNPASLAYQAAVANDNTQRAAEPAAGLAAMQEASANNRAAMQQRSAAAQALASERSAMDRTLITERGNNTRAGITALASTEAARIKAQQEGKAPAGYRYTAGGGMEAIPGGPAAAKVADEQKTKDSALDGSRQTIGTINRLLNSPGREGATGMINVQRFVPGTNAADFAAEVETLKAQTFLPMVQQLRGMGALSNAEGDKLGASIGALNFNMSEKAFQDSLGRIRDQFGSALQRSGVDTKDVANWGLEAPSNTGDQTTRPATAAPAKAPAAAAQRTVSRSGVVDGRRVVQYSDGSVEYAN